MKKDNVTKELVELGTFEVVTTTLRISDPCYDKKTWCAGTVKNALPGTWKAQVIKKTETGTYEYEGKTRDYTSHRNVLIAVHESFDKNNYTKVKTKISGGIDAGMAGIFDDKFYKKDYKEDYMQIGRNEYDETQQKFSFEHELKHLERIIEEQDPKLVPYMDTYRGQLKYKKEYGFTLYKHAVKPTRDWYEVCCDKSLSNVSAGVIRNGVVSSSGYGDGGYTTYTAVNSKGKVVGVKLVF